jgi:CubicO group peptidase (beta-lactamase class C family)
MIYFTNTGIAKNMTINLKMLIVVACLFITCEKASAQQSFDKVDTWLSKETGNMGGRAILLIYKNGHIIYSHGVNKMNAMQKAAFKYFSKRQGKEPDLSDFTPDTRLAVASCSKWLSAALVMTFVDDGELKLTDTVGKYLPVLSKNGKGRITISECLSHLTGIKAPPLKESLDEMKEIGTMDDAIANIAAMPMEGEPGKVFHYSNVGLQIAGAVIEKISGKSFETLFAERIAQPLGMTGTDFGKGKVALPAGGAVSTPNDYLRFLTMILNKGLFNGKRILSAEAVAQMQISRISPDVKIAYSPVEAGSFGYGYGEWVMGYNSVSSPGLFGSFPWVDNGKHYAAFLMTFYIRNTGRNKRYMELMALVDQAIGKE